MPRPKKNTKTQELINIGTNDLQEIQSEAADKLSTVGEEWPHNGCAITLSCILQKANIDVEDTFMAIELCQKLKDLGWQEISIGDQKPGDVGTTCDQGGEPNHGVDHIYLVSLEVKDDDEMLIADNQQKEPHARYVSGNGKSPTTYFLRA